MCCREIRTKVYRMPTGLATDLAATVPVLLPLPLGARYTYGVPEGLAVVPGDFVTVPLGNRRIETRPARRA